MNFDHAVNKYGTMCFRISQTERAVILQRLFLFDKLWKKESSAIEMAIVGRHSGASTTR